jgi:bifunctional DNase/RNase
MKRAYLGQGILVDMSHDFGDDADNLDQPPSFFPYEDGASSKESIDQGEPIEVSVDGVFAADNNGNIQNFVVLNDGHRKIHMVIGSFEAAAITISLEGAKTDRPMTHDLIKVLIDRLEGTIEQVLIDDFWNGTFYAKIHLRCGNDIHEIDSRPSDAIALALRYDSPIFVADKLLSVNE